MVRLLLILAHCTESLCNWDIEEPPVTEEPTTEEPTTEEPTSTEPSATTESAPSTEPTEDPSDGDASSISTLSSLLLFSYLF